MKYYRPSYFSDFRCIADKCQHSCCKGWEIDVDLDTLKKYQAIEGELGEELKNNIEVDESGAHMKLQGEEERCPFLNDKGLCRLILAKGEGILCNICTDHPRYRIFRKNITEEGIGVACEEACRIVLTQKTPFSLELVKEDDIIEPSDSLEEDVFIERDQNISLVQRTEIKLTKIVDTILGDVSYSRKDLFDELEYMNPDFKRRVMSSIDMDVSSCIDGEFEYAFRNLLTYLIFRHPWDGAKTAVEVMLLSARLFENSEIKNLEVLIDIVRETSSELEYSDENLGIIAEYIF